MDNFPEAVGAPSSVCGPIRRLVVRLIDYLKQRKMLFFRGDAKIWFCGIVVNERGRHIEHLLQHFKHLCEIIFSIKVYKSIENLFECY